MTTLPKPPIKPHVDLRDLPYPRDLFVDLLVEAGCPRANAERLVDEELASLTLAADERSLVRKYRELSEDHQGIASDLVNSLHQRNNRKSP